jgi:copper chaperone CopZ
MVDKKGYMIKRGGVVRNWKRRWFVLTGNILYYYRAERDERVGEPAGRIVLDDAHIVSAAKSTKKSLSMEVGTPDRIYYFVAESQKDFTEWFTALKDASDTRVLTTYVESSPVFVFRLAGLVCRQCEGEIQRTLGALPGVRSVTVLFDEETCHVEGAGVEAPVLHRALVDLGYVVGSVGVMRSIASTSSSSSSSSSS